jgi:hypothetical protein
MYYHYFLFLFTRVWLNGDKRGQIETFAENLPGFVDKIRRSPRGTFWVGLHTIRTATNPSLLDRFGVDQRRNILSSVSSDG